MVTQEELASMSPEEIAELQKKNCIFCHIAEGKVPAKKIFEDEQVIGVLDINPAAPGHILLMPKEHFSVMPQVPDSVVGHLFTVAKYLSESVLKAFKVRGTSIYVANGVAAGQKAPHVMLHIIPRIPDDGIALDFKGKKALVDAQKKLHGPLKKFVDKSFGIETVKKVPGEEDVEPEVEPGTPDTMTAHEDAPAVIDDASSDEKKSSRSGAKTTESTPTAKRSETKTTTDSAKPKSKKQSTQKTTKDDVSLDDIADLF